MKKLANSEYFFLTTRLFGRKMPFMKNKNKKIKQFEIARMAGISPSFFSEIINNKKRPSWEISNKLKSVTKIPIRVWMEGTTEHIRELLKRFG